MARFSANSGTILNVTISSPGTAEQLAQHFIPEGLPIRLKANIDNTGNMYWGFSQSDAEGSNRESLVAGESSDPLYIDSSDRIWVDADSASDTLEVVIIKAS